MLKDVVTYQNAHHGSFSTTMEVLDIVLNQTGETVRDPEWTYTELVAYLYESTENDYSDVTSRFGLLVIIASISEHLTDSYYIERNWDRLHKAVPIG